MEVTEVGKVLISDTSKCNGCHNCQIACKDEHCGNDWSPTAKPQPLTGQFWCRIEDQVRGQVPKVKVAYHFHICQHCDEAPCIESCEDDAISKREDGIVLIDPERCTGCDNCIKACPYEGVIYYNEDLKIAQKCTFCAHLLDQGWKEPRCVEVCPTGALVFGEEAELMETIQTAELLGGGYDASPRVYYLNLPKRFIGGLVYDPEKDEIIEGAEVTISAADGSTKDTVTTDEFGDFMRDGLAEGAYTLTIEAKGYISKTLSADVTDRDINVGDIPLSEKK